MADVSNILKEQIAQNGPISVADYMETCLYHPELGYYMVENPFGSKGDFTTAPEMTQLFGEMLAVWVVDSWLKMEEPSSFTLLECGPGRGTLMADLLRTIKRISPKTFESCRPILLEISPTLKKMQQRTLKEQDVEWASTLDEINFSDPAIVIGNEFLDAFPIQQFMKEEERMVDFKDGAFTFTTEGNITEKAPAIAAWLQNLKSKLNGYALFIDYGYKDGKGETLQAVQHHKKIGVFQAPGTSDLTAHVNFGVTMEALGPNNCQINDMSPFLMNLGLPVRAAQLLQKASDKDRKETESAMQRLLHPNEMGALFKVMCYRSAPFPETSGF